MQEIYYVYVTTCLLNGKQYVGDHKTFYMESDPYIGSGTALKKDIKKFGRKNFKREILETFPKREDSFNAQEKYIKQFNCAYPHGYNLNAWGGIKKFASCNISEEGKKRIGDSNRERIGLWHHTKESKNQIGDSNRNKKRSEEIKEKLKKPHRKFSEKTKDKMRNSKLGKPSNNSNGNNQHTQALNYR
jgi:group I intron endonuclease